MATFRVTVQDTRVVERSYDVEALDGDDAIDVFYDEHDSNMEPVHEEVVRSTWEVVCVEEVDSEEFEVRVVSGCLARMIASEEVRVNGWDPVEAARAILAELRKASTRAVTLPDGEKEDQ